MVVIVDVLGGSLNSHEAWWTWMISCCLVLHRGPYQAILIAPRSYHKLGKSQHAHKFSITHVTKNTKGTFNNKQERVVHTARRSVTLWPRADDEACDATPPKPNFKTLLSLQRAKRQLSRGGATTSRSGLVRWTLGLGFGNQVWVAWKLCHGKLVA